MKWSWSIRSTVLAYVRGTAGFPSHTIKACVGVEVYSHSFLKSALDGGEWGNFTPRRLYPQEGTWVPI